MMDVTEISIGRREARDLYRQYRAHQHYSEPIDLEVQRTYQLIAQGRTVIKALQSIVTAGSDARHRPKLAIIRADAAECYMSRSTDGSVTFQPWSWQRRYDSRQIISLPRGSMPGVRADAKAIVPMIPIHLRPKRGLANYHILWEADWEDVPTDPLLLRRIGKGDLWLVCAAWDLTEVERVALQARVH